VGKASLDAMMELAVKDGSFRQQQFRVLKADPVESMQLLFSVALADGEVTTDEGELLRLFAARLEIPREDLQKIVDQARAQLKQRRDTT